MKPEATVVVPKGVPPPRVPEAIGETGLDFTFLAHLALKTVSVDANCTTDRVAERVKLPITVAEQLLQHLYHEKLVNITRPCGFPESPVRHAGSGLGACPAAF